MAALLPLFLLSVADSVSKAGDARLSRVYAILFWHDPSLFWVCDGFCR
jgi:hypothetical protein